MRGWCGWCGRSAWGGRYDFSVVELVVREVLAGAFVAADLPDASDGEVTRESQEEGLQATALPADTPTALRLQQLQEELLNALLG